MLRSVDVSEDRRLARLAPKPIQLSDSEREQLTQIVNRHSTPQQIAFRASIILLADQGQNHQQIASCLNISRDMARLWRNRWLALSPQQKSVLERLTDAERCGTPATFKRWQNSSSGHTKEKRWLLKTIRGELPPKSTSHF